jgi:hypothetical protein
MEYLYLQVDQIFSQESFQTNSAWTAARRSGAGFSIPIRMLPLIGIASSETRYCRRQHPLQ